MDIFYHTKAILHTASILTSTMSLQLTAVLLILFSFVIGSLSGNSFERPNIPEKQEDWMGLENERIVDNYWTQTEENINHDIYFNDNDAIKLVMPPLHYNFNSDSVTEKYRKKDDKHKTVQYARKPKTITPLPDTSFAESKANKKEQFIIKIVSDDELKVPDPCKPTRFVKTAAQDKTWNYEVTEDIKNYLATTAPTVRRSKYFPEIPKQATKESSHNIFLNTGKKNQTNNLQTILSKYNIYSNDKLKNYEASRRTQMYFLPIPLNTPKRNHNRQNNLPVDPLIAVLLSNYGVYLPQFYKTNTGYKNLYGHLAFNNIHNNNPFGNYKLFSGTDYDYDDSLNQQQ